jgi:hypothetical protein
MIDLAKALGLEVPEGADDTILQNLILADVNAMREKMKKATEEEDDEDEEDPASKKTPPAPMAASLLNVLRDNRSMKLDKLVADGRINRAVREDLAKQYCSDANLTLSLSNTDDGFDSVLAALNKNERVVEGGTSGPQTLVLGKDVHDVQKNPLLRDAERRAAAAAKN